MLSFLGVDKSAFFFSSIIFCTSFNTSALINFFFFFDHPLRKKAGKQKKGLTLTLHVSKTVGFSTEGTMMRIALSDIFSIERSFQMRAFNINLMVFSCLISTRVTFSSWVVLILNVPFPLSCQFFFSLSKMKIFAGCCKIVFSPSSPLCCGSLRNFCRSAR